MGKKRKIISHPQFWNKFADHPVVRARRAAEPSAKEEVTPQPKPEPKKVEVKPSPKPVVAAPPPKPAVKKEAPKPAPAPVAKKEAPKPVPKKVRSWSKNKK